MTVKVSSDYRKLEPEEVAAVAAECENAWKSEAIPLRQWTSCVRGELERYREGQEQRHFDVLVAAMKRTGLNDHPTLLDVGASSGFYSEILELGGFHCHYVGCDYSQEYERMATTLYPDIEFKLGDARVLPFTDGEFDIVLSGCVLLHVLEYEKVIAEAARVASKFVVFNRTPVLLGNPTTFYLKHAYNVPCLEIHFNEEELLGLFAKHGLDVVHFDDVFSDPETQFGHRTYLCAVKSEHEDILHDCIK